MTRSAAAEAPRQTRLLTVDQVAEIRKRAALETDRALAEAFGVKARLVADIRRGRVDGVLTMPACMSPEEVETWRGGREWTTKQGGRIYQITPCDDCMPDHALEMRALGLCNGHPAGVEPDQESEEDDTPAVTPAKREERPMVMITAHVEAPCEACIHAVVCGRRTAIASLAAVSIEHEPLPKGVTVGAWAKVECDEFSAARKTSGSSKGRKLDLSPEDRERRRQQALRLVRQRTEATA